MTSSAQRDHWNRRYSGTALIWTAKPNRTLMTEVADLPPGHALDLAAGEGRNAVWLAEQGWTVDAVDLSDVAIEKGRKLATTRHVADRVAFEAADLLDYEMETARYDLVIAMYFHMPWTGLAPVLVRAARAVAPGGTLLIVAHDLENLIHGYGGPQNPDVLYTSERIANLLNQDIEIEKACRIERSVETGDGPMIALDCLVRGKRP